MADEGKSTKCGDPNKATEREAVSGIANGAPDPVSFRFIYSSIAQSVEHLTVNQGVTGSSPVGGANESISFT